MEGRKALAKDINKLLTQLDNIAETNKLQWYFLQLQKEVDNTNTCGYT
jgi:hypothetical protein